MKVNIKKEENVLSFRKVVRPSVSKEDIDNFYNLNLKTQKHIINLLIAGFELEELKTYTLWNPNESKTN